MAIRDRLFGTGPDHIEPAQMDVLDLLVQRDRWRMSEVAGALRVDPSTVTRMVQRMEAAGLAVRSPHDGDGRVVTVELTAKGHVIHESVAARREAILRDLLAELGDADGLRLVELLESFIAVLDDYVAHTDQTPPHGPSR